MACEWCEVATAYSLHGDKDEATAEGDRQMPGEVLLQLAQWAGQTVAAAAVTDVWESARQKLARLLGRGDPKKTEAATRWLAQTREQLTGAGADVEQARTAQAQRWQGRFEDLLDEDPGIEAELRALVKEIADELPAGVVSAADHSVAAGGNVNVGATTGAVAAAVIHGDVSAGNPSRPGPVSGEPDPGSR